MEPTPERLRSYAADVLGISLDRITSVDRFEHGNRHDVFKASYLDAAGAAQAVVVRVSLSGDELERVAAEREASVLEHVGGVAAPVLHDFRSTSPLFDVPAMCMQFVDGQPTPPGAVTLTQIERLGAVTAWVHSRPADDPASQASIASCASARLQSILATGTWARDPLPADAQDRVRRAADAVETSFEVWRRSESFRTDEALALLHGDIAEGNVLWTPDPVLIDWEYARLGDPADEIAYTFDQNDLTEHQRQMFWNGYRQGLGDDIRVAHIGERVTWWEPVTLLGSTLWWVERWVRRTEADAVDDVDPAAIREPAYYLDQVLRRLERLDLLLDRRLRP